MNATFKRNLLLGFGISLLLLIISAVASYNSIKQLLNSARAMNHTMEVMNEVEVTLSAIKDAETGQRGFLLTDRQDFLEPYIGAKDKVNASLNNLAKLTADNDLQQTRVSKLRGAALIRFQRLQNIINQKNNGQEISLEDMEVGKEQMDNIRLLCDQIRSEEQRLLASRTDEMQQRAGYTPIIILLASVLAVVITIIFFLRINNDFQRRLKLQKELEEKDQDINRRINIIKSVAEKISDGDYETRVTDEGKDGLGLLSYSLNKMAGSLEASFNSIADKEWLQSGLANLNTSMMEQKEIEQLAATIVRFTCDYTESNVGSIYIVEDNGSFKLSGSFATNRPLQKNYIQLGEGFPGQAALDQKTLLINDVPEDYLTINYSTGQIKPKHLIAIPTRYEGKVNGVLELGSLKAFDKNDLLFLKHASESIGIVINTAINRIKLQELLEETQAQAEELQVQHAELETMNLELEMKTEKLQASEEELRVQQEELLQANQELEEKAVVLEEKNELISERNIEIQQKAEELAITTKYKSEFLANMSHELRTPLNSILLLSRLMSENNETNTESDYAEYAKVIQSSGQGLLTLINEILDLSKIESGKMELEISQVMVQDILRDTEQIFTPLAQEKNIGFDVQVAQNMPSTITTDPTRIGQVIKNLISNAIKFTGEGSVKVNFEPAKQKGYFNIVVSDTGIGIAADKQQMIFEAFRQADGSTRRKYGGTGLGLSITRELVKLLGGEITLQSEEEKGSRFTVKLPIEGPASVPPADTSGLQDKKDETVTLETATSEEDQPLSTTPSPYLAESIPENIPDDRDNIRPGDKVILIIEDDVNFATSLLSFTHKSGYRGVVAVRGDEGIELANRLLPMGILLDVQLPVKDGFQVIEELKRNPATKHIPVHMLSSYEVKNKSISQGAIRFANKPLEPADLQNIFGTIERFIEQNPKKVLIVEENQKHAKALAYFLENYNVNTQVSNDITDSINALQTEDSKCVILDMHAAPNNAYSILDTVKKTPGLEQLPIIVFTGRSLSKSEEMRIRQYADSIVVKTANSYQRILDEVSLFLHLMAEQKANGSKRRVGALNDVLNNKTIIVADDDVRNIFSLTKALEKFNINVVPAIDGKDALAQLENTKADAVLMDMMMPEMDGYESIRHIKAQPKYRHLPVIAVTAKAMSGDRDKCIQAGASDYITKPVDIDQLLSLLRVWLYDSSK